MVCASWSGKVTRSENALARRYVRDSTNMHARMRSCSISHILQLPTTGSSILQFTYAELWPACPWPLHCKITTSDVLLKVKAVVGRNGSM